MATYIKQLVFTLVFLLLFNAGEGAIAESSSQLRIKTSLRLFRTMLAADMEITNKKNTDGKLFILLVYKNNIKRAGKLGESLEKSKKPGKKSRIRGLPIKTAYTSDFSFKQFNNDKVAGIFITQQIGPAELKRVIQYGIKNRLIVYSPFEGDVEKGVLGGLSVEARVRPFINAKTLKASRVNIKPFFIKVTKFYGEY